MKTLSPLAIIIKFDLKRVRDREREEAREGEGEGRETCAQIGMAQRVLKGD